MPQTTTSSDPSRTQRAALCSFKRRSFKSRPVKRSRLQRNPEPRFKAPHALLSLGVLLAACSDAPLSVGSNEVTLEHGACGNGIVTSSVTVKQQADADALLDCSEIQGDLSITAPADVSLAALGSLRIVHGGVLIENLASLAGLEALEQVNVLDLEHLAAQDLAPLAGMKRVAWDPDSKRASGGYLSIIDCNYLKDLTGLDNLRDWSDLNVVSNAALESLSGLQAPREVDSVLIDLSPQLSNIDALRTIQQAQAFGLSGTSVERFRRFGLRTVGSLTLEQNPALLDLQGLIQLGTIGDLVIRNNDSLKDVQLPLLRSCDSISITENPVLETVPAYATDSTQLNPPELVDAPIVFGWPRLYEVGNNPRLTAVAAPSSYANVQMVAIWGNPSLTGLDLRYLAQADALIIKDNTTLEQLQLDQLASVDNLQVINNPALTTSAFSSVHTFSSTISGNLDTPVSSNASLP